MPCFFLRRICCGTAAAAMLCLPCASAASPTAAPSPARADALAPIESALDALRSHAAEWLSRLRLQPEPAPTDSVRRLIPGGDSIGVALMCEGVLVVGTSDPGTQASPARLAGIRSGDRITHVNGEAFSGASGFRELIASGAPVTLTVCRNDDVREVEIAPISDDSGSEYRIGAWVRDSTAGIGTLTFIDPATGAYGALGHPIQDADTAQTLAVAQGALYDCDVIEIRPGEAGIPGELVGDFINPGETIGTVEKNTSCGIYGCYTGSFDPAESLPAADDSEVRTGSAVILTTLDDGVPEEYDVEITKIYAADAPSSRNMMLRVTDPDLLSATGGIVQGMSGSPICQNGKIVGAVTHVLVNDPTRGYGIFIENMLEAAE